MNDFKNTFEELFKKTKNRSSNINEIKKLISNNKLDNKILNKKVTTSLSTYSNFLDIDKLLQCDLEYLEHINEFANQRAREAKKIHRQSNKRTNYGKEFEEKINELHSYCELFLEKYGLKNYELGNVCRNLMGDLKYALDTVKKK